MMLYFSYGSNMSVKRLSARVPSAVPVTVATLAGHRLKFHKIGQDFSGKCDAYKTGRSSDQIIGVVYELAESEKLQLDRIEGLGNGYTEKDVSVITPDRTLLSAATYVATRIDPSLKPFDWYKIHVLTGAKENRLPSGYVQEIKAVISMSDLDPARNAREMSIYS